MLRDVFPIEAGLQRRLIAFRLAVFQPLPAFECRLRLALIPNRLLRVVAPDLGGNFIAALVDRAGKGTIPFLVLQAAGRLEAPSLALALNAFGASFLRAFIARRGPRAPLGPAVGFRRLALNLHKTGALPGGKRIKGRTGIEDFSHCL